ncbi:putative nuclear pore protein [Phaeomoniella chlamydospora]|uniref:Putative nuclear pore protein n=1 Tax=Phaeomoniella chlamydospora TaxID=158046 RepID=A0A0G2GKU8_PHACM|nr:putative nuclear pore protein [Phaeomoniella chlamydospora]
MQIAKFNVVDSGPPSRTTETCFNVTFDPNVNNVPYILNLPSSNQNIISLAVSSLDCLKIYRSSPTSPSHFYEAARSPPHPALIRSIAWANGNIRGYDTIATGCADGGIRIFDLSTSAPPTQEPQSSSTSTTPSSTAAPGSTPSTTSKPIPQSSLTTAIVGRSVQQQQQQHNQSSAQSTRRNKPNGSYAHSLLLTCSLESHHRDCLAVRFDQTGTLLASMDADGTTIYWKRSVGLHNLWDYSGNTNASDSESLTTAPRAVRSEWLVFAVESEGESEDEDGTNGGEKLGTVEKGGGGGGGAGDGEGIRMGEE